MLYENGELLDKYDLEYMFEKSDKQSIKNMQEIVFCCGSNDALCLQQNNTVYRRIKEINSKVINNIIKGYHDTETFTKATTFSIESSFRNFSCK